MFGKTELKTLKNELEISKSNHNKLLGAIEFLSEERFELCKEIIEFSEKVERLFEMSVTKGCLLPTEIRNSIAETVYDLKEAKTNFNNVILSVIQDSVTNSSDFDRIKIFDNIIVAGAGKITSAGAVEIVKRAATTFGVTSSGTRIADLHGAAKVTASLAKIGGGSIESGGGGMAAGVSRLNAIGSGATIATMLVVPVLIEWGSNKASSREIKSVIDELTAANESLEKVKETLKKDLKANTRRLRRVREMFMELNYPLKTNDQEALSRTNISELFVPLRKLALYINTRISV